MFTETNTAGAEIIYSMKQTPKPITFDFRKVGCEEDWEYVLAFANKNCNGRLATALSQIVKEHKFANTEHKVIISQGGIKLAEL